MVAATVLTVKVDVPVPPATEVGLNAQVAGRVATGVTVQVKATALLNPFTGAIVIVDVAAAPALTEAGASAVAARVKSAAGAAVTVRPTELLWVNPPAVPVTVTLEVATGVAVVVVMVRADVAGDAPGVTAGGTKAQLAPVGRLTPLHDNVTALLKPLRAVTVAV